MHDARRLVYDSLMSISDAPSGRADDVVVEHRFAPNSGPGGAGMAYDVLHASTSCPSITGRTTIGRPRRGTTPTTCTDCCPTRRVDVAGGYVELQHRPDGGARVVVRCTLLPLTLLPFATVDEARAAANRWHRQLAAGADRAELRAMRDEALEAVAS